MTGLLIDMLKASGQSRIINVSSIAHKRSWCFIRNKWLYLNDFFKYNFEFKEAKGIKWDNLMMKNKYDPLVAYSQAKLSNCLFTVELANQFKGEFVVLCWKNCLNILNLNNHCIDITSVSLHPGAVRTEVWREVRFLDILNEISLVNLVKALLTLMWPLFWITFKSCKQGAQTTIHCAVSDEIPQFNGKYFR